MNISKILKYPQSSLEDDYTQQGQHGHHLLQEQHERRVADVDGWTSLKFDRFRGTHQSEGNVPDSAAVQFVPLRGVHRDCDVVEVGHQFFPGPAVHVDLEDQEDDALHCPQHLVHVFGLHDEEELHPWKEFDLVKLPYKNFL